MTTKVFMLCTGLGFVERGFESFFQGCYNTLKDEPSLDITLFKGAGKTTAREITLWSIPRKSWLITQPNKLLSKIHRRVTIDNRFFIETSFFFSLLPHLQRERPEVIYCSQKRLCLWLSLWRRLTKQNYKILFRNGGPILPPFYDWDYIQQLTPIQLQIALDYGESATKHHLVMAGFDIPSQLKILAPTEREDLRHKLGLPKTVPIVISVGLITKSHKRMDYVIQEVAKLPEPRPYVLLLGQQESESPEIIQLGNSLLGSNCFQVKTVPQHQMSDYYSCADIFVLASLHEGMGRVFVESIAHGLPCLAHDFEIARFVVGKEGYFANFKLPGSLTALLSQVLAEGYDDEKRRRNHRLAYERFSWEKLRSTYVEMFHACAAGDRLSINEINSSLKV